MNETAEQTVFYSFQLKCIHLRNLLSPQSACVGWDGMGCEWQPDDFPPSQSSPVSTRGDPMVSFHRYAPAIRGMGDNDISVAQFKIMQRKLIIIWAFSFNLQLQFDGQSRAFQAPLNNRFIVLVAHPRRDSVQWNRPQSTFRAPFHAMSFRSQWIEISRGA